MKMAIRVERCSKRAWKHVTNAEFDKVEFEWCEMVEMCFHTSKLPGVKAKRNTLHLVEKNIFS